MKVFVIHGSPHDGNTLKLTRKFEEAVKRNGHVDFEYLFLKKADIKMCRGCFNCITRGEELCSLKNDDVKQIIKKMDKADGVIFSAPTYVFSIPALMKNLVDRLAYLGHRPRYMDKYAVVISTTCGVGLKEALKYLSFCTAKAWGFKLVGTLGAFTHPFNLDKKSQKKLDKEITVLADKFYKAMARKEASPVSFEEIMRFRVMSAIAQNSKEMFAADHRYYCESRKPGQEYHLRPGRIGFFANLFSKLLAYFISKSMQKERKRAVDINQEFLEW